MKKRIISLLILCLICLSFALPAYAANAPRLMDNAGLLTESEASELLTYLDTTSANLNFDIVVCTVNSTDGYAPAEYADMTFKKCDFGKGENKAGVILLISMAERDCIITASEGAENILGDDARNFIADAIVPDLSSGDYYTAFDTFASLCETFVENAKTGGEPYKAPFEFPKAILIALIVGVLIAIIVVAVLKGQLKSVRFQPAASDYLKDGSLNVTEARERFLYHTVTRTERSTSSSGSSASSRSTGRKF